MAVHTPAPWIKLELLIQVFVVDVVGLNKTVLTVPTSASCQAANWQFISSNIWRFEDLTPPLYQLAFFVEKNAKPVFTEDEQEILPAQ